MRRAVAVVVVTALVVVTLGAATVVLVASLGSDGGDAPRPDPPAGTPSASGRVPAMPAPPAGLQRYYDQQVAWAECEDDAGHECATLRVPLDYADPEGREIELALLRVPADEPELAVGSLVVNPGGPGAPGTSYAAAEGDFFGRRLLDHFDLVGFDPRGVGDSTAVDCLSDEELDAQLAADPDPDTAAEVAAYQRQVREMGAGCVELSGELAAHVTTVEAARDLDVLRAVLGQPRLNFFGASYGTELGATYAQLFPGRVGRMVLDGAVDLDASGRDLALQQARGFETALRAYVANCVDSGDCFLGDSVEEGVERIQGLLADVDAEPLPGDGERELTAGTAYLGLIAPLYNRDFWTVLSLGLRAALGGDGATLLALADAYAYRGEDGYEANVIEANYAIGCLDDPESLPMAEAEALVPAFERASPTLGRAFAYGLTGCSGQVARSDVRPPANVRARGAPPLLVIGTTRDPATPLRWAEELAAQLDSAVLVTRDGDGHTGYRAGNGCVDTTVEDYLVDGTVPPADVDCPAA